MTATIKLNGRDEVVKAIKGRKVLVWATIGGESIMVEVAPSKLTTSLWDNDKYEFLECDSRDTGHFLELRMNVPTA